MALLRNIPTIPNRNAQPWWLGTCNRKRTSGNGGHATTHFGKRDRVMIIRLYMIDRRACCPNSPAEEAPGKVSEHLEYSLQHIHFNQTPGPALRAVWCHVDVHRSPTGIPGSSNSQAKERYQCEILVRWQGKKHRMCPQVPPSTWYFTLHTPYTRSKSSRNIRTIHFPNP